MGRLPDPSWKSGPSYPEPTASEHAIGPEPAGVDVDGVGRDEAERLDSEPICALREAFVCSRDGCDIDAGKAHVYALSDVSQRVQQAALYAVEYTTEPTTEDLVEYLAMNAKVVDYDHVPIIGFEFGDDVLGYVEPNFTDERGFGGECYGRDEPEPDIDAYRYDL